MTEYAVLEKLDEIKSLLESKVGDRWISIREVCKYSSLSQSTIRRLIQSGKLKCSRETGKLLFKKNWIDRFLLFGKMKITPAQRKNIEEL